MSLLEKKRLLIKDLMLQGYIVSEKVRRAFEKVPREEFVPENYREYAYVDTPLPIGYDQTISAPHMVAIMTERLELDEGMIVLEVGTGSGYQAAIIAEIIDPESRGIGHVVSIEFIPELAEFARKNLIKTGFYDRVSIIVGDGGLGTFENKMIYDRIIVTAASPKIPKKLLSQLKINGIMVVPIGSRWHQILYIIKKISETEYITIEDIPCVFVPLRGLEGFDKKIDQR
ncbi:MAG: protein-L-isoaspartate(D-aspartate) O-methyltransferase [Desulfurococcales archaeon]|jgi:protein-L-isoaspartate(D-aspartate) O-methyltransferase|nr:protein-L-isoaspartate(D-aspartate) O-methyltransferase [Desulfurococcales archaeon]MCI4457483.1 protein-L-isoaspartate(D-aspartate) O-methyltransferase [Desulfurococcaceae archaeon]